MVIEVIVPVVMIDEYFATSAVRSPGSSAASEAPHARLAMAARRIRASFMDKLRAQAGRDAMLAQRRAMRPERRVEISAGVVKRTVSQQGGAPEWGPMHGQD